MAWALPEWTVLAVLREGPHARVRDRGADRARGCAGPGVAAAAAIAAECDDAKGFDAVLLPWRHSNVTAALRFLDEIEP